MATEKLLRGTTLQTIYTFSSLANNTQALSSAVTLTDSLYPYADAILSATFGAGPSAGGAVKVWLLREDGSGNYEDGGSSVIPARSPDFVFPVRATDTTQIENLEISLPPGTFKALCRNDATGQTISSGTIKFLAFTRQAV